MNDSEQRLRLAIATGKIGLWVWDSTHVTNAGDWSDRLKEIFGLPLSTEVTHDLFLSCVHPEDRERVNAGVMAALGGANAGEYVSEYRAIRQSDGAQRCVTARGQAFFDQLGQAIRFIGTVMDVTEQKYAQEELEARIAHRTSELEAEIAERRRALDSIPGLVWTARADGSIEYLNKRWLEYTGLTLDQAQDWGWLAAVHEDDVAGLTGYWTSIIGAARPGEYEARLRAADGTFRWFLFRGVPVFGANQAVLKWYGTNTDIDELRAQQHVATGQLEALKTTLNALTQESDPDQLLEHVLRGISDQLNGDSICVWERTVANHLHLRATFEDNRLQLPAPGLPTVSIDTGEHPVWQEVFHTGTDCVLGEHDVDPPRIRLANREGSSWHPWHGEALPHPDLPGRLTVPMVVGGRVEGTTEVRFRHKRLFRPEEIELTKALSHQAMLAIRLSRLTLESRQAAVTAERNRLARDIHDTLAQTFTGVIVQLEAAEDALAHGLPQAANGHLTRAQNRARDGLQEARRTVHAIRADKELSAAMHALVQNATAGTHLRATFRLQGQPRPLDAEWEDNLLRICQEALTNSLRHARAYRFSAYLAYEPDAIRLELQDDGQGFRPSTQPAGFGLTGMQERVHGLGGQLQVRTAVGKGTTIVAVIPAP